MALSPKTFTVDMVDEVNYNAVNLSNDETFTVDIVKDDTQAAIDCSCMSEDECFCVGFGGTEVMSQAWIERLLQAEYVIFDCGTSTRNI